MARPLQQPALVRYALPAVLAFCIASSFAPARFVAWQGWFASAAAIITAPVSHPIDLLGRLFVPPTHVEEQRTREEIAQQLEDERLRRQQAELENDRLRTMIDELQKGLALTSDTPVELVPAPVVGLSGKLLRVRVGEAQGVAQGQAVTAGGVHLLGRVERVDGPTSLVGLITERGRVTLRGAVMLDQAERISTDCFLIPQGDGTLQGDVASPPDGYDIEPGQRVRLDDRGWSDADQMLIVGIVERVEPHPDEPVRQVVTVRPVLDLRRVAEVIIRVPRPAGRGAAQGEGGDG